MYFLLIKLRQLYYNRVVIFAHQGNHFPITLADFISAELTGNKHETFVVSRCPGPYLAVLLYNPIAFWPTHVQKPNCYVLQLIIVSHNQVKVCYMSARCTDGF